MAIIGMNLQYKTKSFKNKEINSFSENNTNQGFF